MNPNMGAEPGQRSTAAMPTATPAEELHPQAAYYGELTKMLTEESDDSRKSAIQARMRQVYAEMSPEVQETVEAPPQ